MLNAELASLHPRLQLVDLAVRALPHLAFPYLRTGLYRLGGVAIGARTLLAGRLDLIGPGDIGRRLKIGERCWLNAPVFADLTGDITIGDGVTLGHQVVLVTARHALGESAKRAGPTTSAPIVIGDGAWIAACVTILPGVKIGPGAIVGAGSVVTRDVPAHTLVVGNPARVVRRLDQAGPRRRSKLTAIGPSPHDGQQIPSLDG